MLFQLLNELFDFLSPFGKRAVRIVLGMVAVVAVLNVKRVDHLPQFLIEGRGQQMASLSSTCLIRIQIGHDGLTGSVK
jgi:hypothetical protein